MPSENEDVTMEGIVEGANIYSGAGVYIPSGVTIGGSTLGLVIPNPLSGDDMRSAHPSPFLQPFCHLHRDRAAFLFMPSSATPSTRFALREVDCISLPACRLFIL